MRTQDTDRNQPDAEPPRFDYRMLLSVLPLIAFWIGYQYHTYAAIGLGFVATIAAYFLSNRKGIVGVLAIFGLVVATGAALAGLILADERAFLARDAASDFLIALIALGSIAFRRPLVGIVLREFAPHNMKLLPLQHRAFVLSTLVLVLVNVIQGIVRTWMLFGGLSVGQYLIFSRLFGWPTALAMFVVIAWILRRALEQARRDSGSNP